MKKFFITFSAFALLTSLAANVKAEIKHTTFQVPNIKQVFCGPVMPFKYCKCAFHGQYCDDIGMDSSSANKHVQAQFTAWIAPQKQAFYNKCAADPNSYFRGETCVTCIHPHYRRGDDCQQLSKICSEDPHVKYNIKSEECYCDEGWEWDASERVCKEEEEIIIEFAWVESKPVFIANGKESGTFTLVVLDKETAENKVAELSVSLGNLKITKNSPGYYEGIYTVPDLMESTSGLNQSDSLNIAYKSVSGDTRVERVEIPLLTGQPFKVTYPGFEPHEGVIAFTSPTGTITVTGFDGANQFPLQGAEVELLSGGYATTDGNGVAVLKSPQETNNSKPAVATAVLTFTPKVEQILKGAMNKYLEIGEDIPIIYNFLRNFGKRMGQATNSVEAQKLLNGLTRTEYALYYLERGQELGFDSVNNLGGAVNEAVWNVIDSVGNIIESAENLKKYLPGTKAGKASSRLIQKLDNVKSELFKKMGEYFQAGITKYAPNYTESVSNLFSRLDSKLFGEGAKPLMDKAGLQDFIANHFKEEQKKTTRQGLSRIAQHIANNDWSPVRTRDGLEQARNQYDQMIEKFRTAHQDEYSFTMSKAYADLAFDTVGTVSDFTAWGPFVSGLETFYKGVRTAYMDSSNMYNWFQSVGQANQSTQNSLNYALGDSERVPAVSFLPKIIFSAKANEETFILDNLSANGQEMPEAERNQVIEYGLAKTDQEIYESLLEMINLLIEAYPESETQVADTKKDLENKFTQAQSATENLEKVAELSVAKINKNGNPLDVNGDGQINMADMTTTEWVVLGSIILIFAGIIWIFIRIFRGKKSQISN